MYLQIKKHLRLPSCKPQQYTYILYILYIYVIMNILKKTGCTRVIHIFCPKLTTYHAYTTCIIILFTNLPYRCRVPKYCAVVLLYKPAEVCTSHYLWVVLSTPKELCCRERTSRLQQHYILYIFIKPYYSTGATVARRTLLYNIIRLQT